MDWGNPKLEPLLKWELHLDLLIKCTKNILFWMVRSQHLLCTFTFPSWLKLKWKSRSCFVEPSLPPTIWWRFKSYFLCSSSFYAISPLQDLFISSYFLDLYLENTFWFPHFLFYLIIRHFVVTMLLPKHNMVCLGQILC